MPGKEGTNKTSNDPQKDELDSLKHEIHISWLKDTAKVEEMQRVHEILREIFSLDKMEDYFKNPETFQYFMKDFTGDVLNNILAQATVYGENGEISAFQILKDYMDLFIKFHNNPSYSILWMKVKEIFSANKPFYCYSQLTKLNNSLKALSAIEYNTLYLKKKEETEEEDLEQNKEVDLFVASKEAYNFHVWVRAIICNVFEEHISIRSPVSESPHIIKKGSYEIAKLGTYTKDWEWRCNLKEGDIIDCFERATFYPATVVDKTEKEFRGIKKIEYRLGFRIYEDSVEDFEKYKMFWKEEKINFDSQGRKYIGDANLDENIPMYSKRLYKKDTKIWKVKGKRIGRNANDSYDVDELFESVDKEGKKTISIARKGTYSYFFNSLITYIGQQGFFEMIINSLSQFNSTEKPITNEVLMVGFNILFNCAEYLYYPYAVELCKLLKEKVFSYLDVLSNTDLRNLKKETIDLISETLKKYLSIANKNSDEDNDTFEKFQIAFSMKMLKTDFLEKRNAAMKGIIDLIKGTHYEKEKQIELLKLIKENKIINEIFGPNSHVQLISKSKELIEILLDYNELDKEEMDLIWSCIKNGDLEAKLSIVKIFKEFILTLNPKYVKMTLESILNAKENQPSNILEGEELIEDEQSLIFDLIDKLIEKEEDSPIIKKYIENFIQQLTNIPLEETDKIKKYLEKIVILGRQHKKIKIIVVKKAIDLIQSGNNFNIGYKLINAFRKDLKYPTDNEFSELLLKDDFIIKLYKKSFDDYITKEKEELKDIPKDDTCEGMDDNLLKKETDYFRCIHTFLEFLLSLINTDVWTEEDELLIPELEESKEEKESPIDFIYNHLYLKNISSKDKFLFYTWCKSLLSNRHCIKKIYQIFTQKICSSQESIENLPDQGFDLFWEMFLKLNNSVSDTNCGIISTVPAQELDGFELLWKIIFESKSKNIMLTGIHYLNMLFRTFDEEGCETNEGLQKLIGLCINELKKENNNSTIKSIAMLNRIIEESEKYGTADIVSHMGLQSRNLHIVNVNPMIIHHSDDFVLTLPSNTTIFQMKKEISNKLDIHYDFLKFEIRSFNGSSVNEGNNSDTESEDYFGGEAGKENITLGYLYNGKTFYSLGFPHEIFITVSKNGLDKKIPREEILVDGEPTAEIIGLFNEWFDKYSENNQMTPTLCGKFVKEVTKFEGEIGPNDTRVTELFKERDSNDDGLLEREEFIEFYIESLKLKPSLVYENISSMGYRNDLKKMNENYFPVNTDKTTMPRYQLAVNEDFFSAIFNSFGKVKENYDSLSEKDKKENERIERMNLEIFQLIDQLVTNPKIYDNILNYKGENWSEVLNENNIHKMVYCLEIIEAVIDHVKQGEIEKIEVFQEWVKTFIEKNGYDYLIQIFLKLLGEIEKKKSRIIMISINALIRNIKILCINSHEAYVQTKLHEFLVKENLCEKINNSIKAFDIISNLLKILKNFINTKEYEITNEIFELLSLIIPTVNLSENFDYDLFLNIIKEGLLNENIFIRDNFYSVIIRMVYLLIEQDKFNLIERIMNHILECIKTLDKSKGSISNYLFNIFTTLLDDYFENKEKYGDKFKNAKFNDPEYIKQIAQIIKDGLDKKLRISDEIFIGYIRLISIMAKVNPEIKEYISKETSLIKDILTKILFKDNSKIEEENKEDFIKIEDDLTKTNENKKSKNQKRKACYEFISNMLENSIENIENFFKMDLLSSKETEEEETDISSGSGGIYGGYSGYGGYGGYSVLNNYSNYSFYSNRKSEERKREGYVGLKNLGCICYMNSSLQQFFMVPSLRYGLLRFDDGEPINPTLKGIDDNMFHQTQKLFSYLLLSERMDYNPYGFTYAFKDFEGAPTKIIEQKDAQEFLSIFFDRIENATKQTKYKYLIQSIFGGKNCSQIKCLDCNKISNRFEDLLFLSLQVKNMKNLNESLLKQIAEERIEGYECEGCKKKVTISKRNILSSLPNVLIIHLQRIFYNFEYDHNEKINSYLEFPRHLNLKPFTLEEISNKEEENDDIYYRSDAYYNYYLVGVVIHMGSADSGHYYSYINTIRGGQGDIADYDENDRRMDNYWLEYNDSNISKFNIEKLNDECFGGTTQTEGTAGYFWGQIENCKNAYLLVYERKIKMPHKIIINQDKIEKKINSGMKLLEINNSTEMNEVNKRFDLLRYYGTDEYKTKCNEIYSTIFHDKEKEEYYVYKPFYFKTKKVPKRYFNEILKDNTEFNKKQNISDKDFIDFIGEIISVLERTLTNSANKINEESLKTIAKTYLDFMFNILTNKDKIEFLKKAKENLIKIVNKIPQFQEVVWDYLLTNPNVFSSLINENGEIVSAIINLIYELIEIVYKNNKEEFEKHLFDFNEIQPNETQKSIPQKASEIILKILDKFPAIENKYLSELEQLLAFFYKLNLLSEKFKIFFLYNGFIPKMITYLLGKDSPYYTKTISTTSGNWDYGIRADAPGANYLIEVIFDICQHSKVVMKEDGLPLNEDDLSCICSPAFLKTVFSKDEEHFQNFLLMFSKDNYEFTLFSSAELVKSLDNISPYHAKQEFISIINCCQKLFEIEDDYQQLRYEIFFGLPTHEVKQKRRGLLPLLGYNAICNSNQSVLNFNCPIFQSEGVKTIISKIIDIRNITKTGAEVFLEILKQCADNHSLYKFILNMPHESPAYHNFLEYGNMIIHSFGEEDNPLKAELLCINDYLDKTYSEILLKDEKLLKTYPPFVGSYLLSTVKYFKITKLFEEGSITIYFVDYFCDYVPYEYDATDIDYSNSQSHYNTLQLNDDNSEIKEEENFKEEDLLKEGIILVDADKYSNYGEEKFFQKINLVFGREKPKAAIVENQYSVPGNKNLFRRIIAINEALEENFICLKFQRKNKEIIPNEYLPMCPIIFKLSYSEVKEIYNVSKVDVNKEWTFEPSDISIEIGSSFYNIEFPLKIKYY
ncbi:MAG: hypothetical protein MJ252_01700 [archaeon]|nr:hypothetical protein [archaeon]